MAATTLKAIIDRFQAVLEAAPLSLKKTKDAFSHDRQPNALLTDTYYLADDGIGSSIELTNNTEARIDRLTVWIARKIAFDGVTALETMETTLNTLERYMLADGPAQSYHPRLEARRVSRPAGKDVLIASVTFSVDFDFSKATS